MGGCCVSKRQIKAQFQKKKPIKIMCPICEEGLDTDDHKPLIVCENNHNLCQQCLKSLTKLAIMKKKPEVQCPFCKKPCFQDTIKTDVQIYSFLQKEEETLKVLPGDRKKLFAFSTVYLPSLHRLIKEESQNKQKDKDKQLTRIDCIKIRGKMLYEYEIFQMDMLQCLTNLKRLYLNNNEIKGLDLNQYTHNKLHLLDLANNNFSAMKLLTDNSDSFNNLRILNLQNNQIQDIKGLRRLEMLQVLNLRRNKIKSMKGLQESSALKDLNLEFNLIQRFQYQPSFNGLRALSLFGNNLPQQTWRQFITYGWHQLRLLSLTVNRVLFQKEQVHVLLMSTKWNYLQLIISQVVDPQLEDMSAIDEKGLVFDKLSMLIMNEVSYEIYWNEKKSFLFQALKSVKEYDRLGTNINFKPYMLQNSNYQLNENSNIISKVKEATVPLDYLYHSKSISAKDQGYKFFRFKSKTNKVIVGICFAIMAVPQQTTYIDFSNGLVCNAGQEETVQSLVKPVKEPEEKEFIFRVNLNNRVISIVIDGVQTYVVGLNKIKKEVIFFISLKQKDTQVRIINLQLTD